jgi:predicted RNase H-like HicB family nuclease
MNETLRLTIVYEDGGDGWIVASIPEVPGTHSQGHSREEARENVIDALQTMLTPDEALIVARPPASPGATGVVAALEAVACSADASRH